MNIGHNIGQVLNEFRRSQRYQPATTKEAVQMSFSSLLRALSPRYTSAYCVAGFE